MRALAMVIRGYALPTSLLVAAMATAASCGPKQDAFVEEGDGTVMPPGMPSENGPSSPLMVGGTARVTADFLNLRTAAGTSATILTEMPCGASVTVLDGPSTGTTSGWWQVSYTSGASYTGWASGKYLIEASDFVAESCGSTAPMVDGGSSGMVLPAVVSDIFDRAKLGVGYSYWWGHGAWRSDGFNIGSCSGNCPSCTHSGSYGADCSGFMAQVWQVPSPSALAVDQHPFTSENFYYDQTYWTQVGRAGLTAADALVRRSGGSGHVALVESADDPYGDVWVYEARGCASGITHDLRSFDSSYRAIRRKGL